MKIRLIILGILPLLVSADPVYVDPRGGNIILDPYDMKNHNYRICAYDGDSDCVLTQNVWRGGSTNTETNPGKPVDHLRK